MGAGNPSAAVGHLETVYKSYPKSIDVRLDLGEAYFRAERYEDAANEAVLANEGEKVSDEQQQKYSQLENELMSKAKELGLTTEDGGQK